MRYIRYGLLATTFATLVYGGAITVPLDDGAMAILEAHFIRQNQYGSYVPELAFMLMNQTSSPWRTIKLQFDIAGLCKGEPRKWTLPVITSLGWAEDHQFVREYEDMLIPLVGNVDGCTTTIIKASLLLAESTHTRIDLEKQVQADTSAQTEEERRVAEGERINAEAEAKQQAARRKRLAAE